MKRVWAERFAALFIGLGVTILLLEVVMRLAFGSLPNPVRIMLRDVKVAPWTNDRLLPKQVWQADNAYQLVIQPNLDNSLQYPDPRVGFHVSTKNYLDPNSQLGFRVPSIDWEPAWPVDGVVVGDSFSFCYVEYDECWVRQLETQHGQSMVNLGMVATGSISRFNALATFGMPYQPRFVVWQWYGNDFNDDYGMMLLTGEVEPEETPVDESIDYARRDQWLRENSTLYQLTATIVEATRTDNFTRHTRFADPYSAAVGDQTLEFGQSYIMQAFDLDEEKNQLGKARSQAAILAARDRLAQDGIPLLIVMIPTKEEVYEGVTSAELGTDLDTLRAGRTAMHTFCADENLLCLDAFEPLNAAAQNDQLVYFHNDTHINAAGNAILTEAVWQFIQDNVEAP